MTEPEDDRSAYLLGNDDADADDDLRAEHDSAIPALEDEPTPDEPTPDEPPE